MSSSPYTHKTPLKVVVGTQTERGLFVKAMIAAGYQVLRDQPFALKPLSRPSRGISGKSDAGHLKVAADLVGTDRHNHSQVGRDNEHAQAIKILARSHHNLIGSASARRTPCGRCFEGSIPLRSKAFGNDLSNADALAIRGPGRRDRSRSGDRYGHRSKRQATVMGRKHSVTCRAEKIQQHLRAEHLSSPSAIADAPGSTARSLVALIGELNRQIAALEAKGCEAFCPALGHLGSLAVLSDSHPVLGARMPGEFGTTRAAMPMPRLARTLRARRRYQGIGPRTSLLPASLATGVWATPATCGR
jgi:hypothetical protein